MTPPPEFDPYALLDHPELAKAPGAHDGKRTEPCLCTSDDSGSSHDAQHPGEYLNDYGDWEECGWCGGRGFRYADCTRCDGSSFEPADPAPLPDTGDGRPLSDEERIPLALHVLGQIVSSYQHFDGEDNEVIRSAIEAGERLLTDVSLPPAPSPSQPEPGTLINCSKTAFRTENHDPHEHRFEGDATAWCRGLDVPALRTPTASADGEPDQPEWDCTEGDHDGLLAYSENTIAPDGSWSFHARGYGDHPDGWEAVADRVSEAHWPAPPAVPGDRPDPLADLVPLAEDVLDAATDRSGFRNGRLLADAVIDADAQPAHPAPDGEPGSLHLGAEDRFHLWAHINTIHQETAPTQRGLTEITFDHVHEEAACALAYFDPAPPGGYGVADGTAK